jgi:hypothetical protein
VAELDTLGNAIASSKALFKLSLSVARGSGPYPKGALDCEVTLVFNLVEHYY